jgi:hypothetical protein
VIRWVCVWLLCAVYEIVYDMERSFDKYAHKETPGGGYFRKRREQKRGEGGAPVPQTKKGEEK